MGDLAWQLLCAGWDGCGLIYGTIFELGKHPKPNYLKIYCYETLSTLTSFIKL